MSSDLYSRNQSKESFTSEIGEAIKNMMDEDRIPVQMSDKRGRKFGVSSGREVATIEENNVEVTETTADAITELGRDEDTGAIEGKRKKSVNFNVELSSSKEVGSLSLDNWMNLSIIGEIYAVFSAWVKDTKLSMKWRQVRTSTTITGIFKAIELPYVRCSTTVHCTVPS